VSRQQQRLARVRWDGCLIVQVPKRNQNYDQS
jgi:hypothetical protein